MFWMDQCHVMVVVNWRDQSNVEVLRTLIWLMESEDRVVWRDHEAAMCALLNMEELKIDGTMEGELLRHEKEDSGSRPCRGHDVGALFYRLVGRWRVTTRLLPLDDRYVNKRMEE